MASNSKFMANKMVGKKKNTFLSDLKAELKKVSWTTKKELSVNTKIVLIATFLFGIGIYVVDVVLRNILFFLNFLARLI